MTTQQWGRVFRLLTDARAKGWRFRRSPDGALAIEPSGRRACPLYYRLLLAHAAQIAAILAAEAGAPACTCPSDRTGGPVGVPRLVWHQDHWEARAAPRSRIHEATAP
jgi:hypothetical protein